jgi:hypothetical protein
MQKVIDLVKHRFAFAACADVAEAVAEVGMPIDSPSSIQASPAAFAMKSSWRVTVMGAP